MRYTLSQRVRSSYESGPDGGLHHGTIARFALQVGYLVTEAMGISDAWMAEQGTTFVVRELKIEYGALTRENEALNLTTWLSQVRRFRGSREVMIVAADDERMIANLSLDWVYVKRDTLAPTRFPAELMGQLSEETATARDWAMWNALSPQDGMPDGSPSPAHVAERVVRYHELDVNRHVNTGVYIEWLEQDWSEATGRLPNALAGHKLEFLKSAVLGETVRVTTRQVNANLWAQTIELVGSGEASGGAPGETLVTNLCFARPTDA